MLTACRTLERQEAARDEALEAFHASIAARATAAGPAAVAENRARQEREDRLIAASEAKALAEAEAKHVAEVAKRAAQAADMRATAAAAAAAKMAAAQAAAQEQDQLRAAMLVSRDADLARA